MTKIALITLAACVLILLLPKKILFSRIITWIGILVCVLGLTLIFTSVAKANDYDLYDVTTMHSDCVTFITQDKDLDGSRELKEIFCAYLIEEIEWGDESEQIIYKEKRLIQKYKQFIETYTE